MEIVIQAINWRECNCPGEIDAGEIDAGAIGTGGNLPGGHCLGGDCIGGNCSVPQINESAAKSLCGS